MHGNQFKTNITWLLQGCPRFWLVVFFVPVWQEQRPSPGRMRWERPGGWGWGWRYMQCQQNLQYLLRRPLQPQVRWIGGGWRQVGWRRWGDHQSHLQPSSWPRWLQRLGNQHRAGRNWPEGNSDWWWEARLPRSSWRPEKWRSPRSIGWGQWLSLRSISFKRALSS